MIFYSVLGIHVFTIVVIHLMNWLFYHYIITFFVTCYSFWGEVYCVLYKYCYIFFLLVFLSIHFELMWVSYRQHTVGSHFSIHSVILYLLIGILNPFIFTVIIDRWEVTNAILLFSDCFVFPLSSSSSLSAFFCEFVFHSGMLWFPSIFCVSTVGFCFVVSIRLI